MNLVSQTENSLSEVHESVNTIHSAKGWKKVLAYLGPAYLVSVGYMDPGNWATDLTGWGPIRISVDLGFAHE